MIKSLTFRQNNLSLADSKTYLFIAAFIAGNLALPQLCHAVALGGKIFLPIYFFTLIASYKFGFRAGIITALASPVLNYLLFTMPAAEMLPVILIKSSLLAVAASVVAGRTKGVSLPHLVAVVAAYLVVGGVAEWAVTGSFAAAVQDFTVGLPGAGLQVVLGYVVLRLMR